MNKMAAKTVKRSIKQQRTKVAFQLSSLSGPTSQFFSGTHEFSELVLVRMSLLMDQSRSVFPVFPARVGQSAENLIVLAGKSVHLRLGPFHLNWQEPALFARLDREN